MGVVLLRRHRHFPHQLPVYPLKTRARAKLVHLFSQKTHTHTSLVKEAEKGTRHKFRYSLFCDARFLTRCRKEAVCLYDAILFFSLILNQCPRFFLVNAKKRNTLTLREREKVVNTTRTRHYTDNLCTPIKAYNR